MKHVLNVQLWFAKYLNQGKYNTKFLKSVFQKLKVLYTIFNEIKEKVKELYPTLDSLKKMRL